MAHLWDNGKNVVDELGNVMKVRRLPLRRFGENNIREGAAGHPRRCAGTDIHVSPLSGRSRRKVVGGQDYTFSLKGKGDRNPQIVAPEGATTLDAVMDTIKPDALMLPESLLKLIPPRPLIRTHSRRLPYSHTTDV